MRWKCTVAYDGTDFFGWQSQEKGNTIQDLIEHQLKIIFKQPIRIHGSGRTDSGVHAKGQVFHFDGEWKSPGDDLLNALRGGLPESILVSSARRVSSDFHARYSAKGKKYIYKLYEGYAPPSEIRYCWSLGKRRLNITSMRLAAKQLLGKHDFTAFAAERDNPDEHPIKDLRRLDIVKNGPRINITTEANGYLYKMVRSLVGALVDVGCGKLSRERLVEILESRQRTHRVYTAPGRGLSMDRVFY
jgi:tRNA pseudouridine38-40 synthase